MLISSLEKMEEIVKKNPSLIWDGWDVLHIHRSNKAKTSRWGMRVNGKWFIYRRFPITEKGWDLPAKLVGANG